MRTYRTYGYLKYDPVSETTRYDPWWLAVMCPMGLALFYQDLIYKEASKTVAAHEAFGFGDWPVIKKQVKVKKSVWGPHVSLIRGEEPSNKELWGKYDGKKIWFEYSPIVGTNGCHYWLPVYSKEFFAIRVELGLPPETRAPFHFTIGRDVDAPSAKRHESKVKRNVIRK